ncbi:hypothetical protein GpartN1_g5772.t1 [Galdieria partita]|uniref:Bicarbonate transporter-like transmembrane domain-containing protein n=1 Tax=Galdieria partita TaxID=83374 RepID=A0A9C7Q1W7_9RHOD|nr:hypothetical protein GpartN1_g5772.t1 [Galdieria partita]
MSSYQPSISEADLSVFQRNAEDTFECVIHPVTLPDFSEDLVSFSVLDSLAKDKNSVIKARFRGEDPQEIILKLLQLLERRNLITKETHKEARSKLLQAEDYSLVDCDSFSWDVRCGKALGYWTHSIQGPFFTVGYASLDNIEFERKVISIIQLVEPVNLGAINGSLTEYVGLVLTGSGTSMVDSGLETAKTVASLLADSDFREESFCCPTDDELRIAIHRFVGRQLARKEQTEKTASKPLSQHVQHESNDATLNQTIGIMNEKIYANHSFHCHPISLLRYWASLLFLHPFVLVIADLKRRLPHYLSDFVFEINQRRAQQKYLFASIFLIFTATLPAIVFGYIVERTTHGQIGVIECLFSQGVLGLGFAIFSGQPLMVNMITGPTVVYIQVLMRWSDKLGFEFLPFYTWTGIWMSIFLILAGCLNTAALIPYLGRFTDEIFQTFIGFIFIQYWFTEFIRITHSGYTQVLLFLFLSSLTLILALLFRFFRDSYLLIPSVRSIFGDIGPSLGVLIVTGISYAFDPVTVERLDIRGPIGYSTTTGRPWVVPIGEIKVGYVFLAAVTGFLLFLVVFIDQNVCTYIVERPENRLRKGTAYSWNMVVVGVLNIIASILGMPWMYAGLPHSLLHVYALADIEERESMGRISYHVVHAREVRIVGLIAYLFSFLIILAKPALDQLPIDVVWIYFIYGCSILSKQWFN